MRLFRTVAIPAWVIILALATLLVGVAGHDLWTPDEPREAAIAQAMGQDGSWLIPHLGQRPFVEKPPLYYWVSWGMMRALAGLIDPTSSARATSAVCAALTLLAIWGTVRTSWGKERGKTFILVLTTTFFFFRAGHWIIIDPLLMLLVGTAVAGLFMGLARNLPFAILAGYLAAGLAFLAKGPVGWALLLFPWGAILLLYRREFRGRLRLHLFGAALALSLPLIWMRFFYLEAGPELWREWLLDNQVGRFSGTAVQLGHIKGPFYYLGLLPLGLLPWTPVLLGWVGRRGGKKLALNREGKNLLLISLAWGAGGLLLLSAAGTKREVYLYPLLPAFAALITLELERIPAWGRHTLRGIALLLLAPLAIFSFLILAWENGSVEIAAGVNPPVLLAALAGIWSFRRLRANIAAQTGASAAIFLITASLIAAPILDKVWSYRRMTMVLAAAIPDESRERVCVWGEDEATQGVFSFYSGIDLPSIEDPDRISLILSGRDPEYDLIVIPRLDEFEEENPGLPPWIVLAREHKGPRRIFYLIGPVQQTPDQVTSAAGARAGRCCAAPPHPAPTANAERNPAPD